MEVHNDVEHTKDLSSIDMQRNIKTDDNSFEYQDKQPMYRKRKVTSLGRTGTLDQFKLNKKNL